MKGFTLIETLVAIAILTIAIAGPLYTANRSLVAARISRDQLIAINLAQEGLEVVRNERGTDYIRAYANPATTNTATQVAWDKFNDPAQGGTAGLCKSPALCTLDPLSLGTAVCSGGVCSPLYIASSTLVNNGSSFYTQNGALTGAVLTPFTRSVTTRVSVTSQVTGKPVDVVVISKVTWNDHGTPYSLSLSEDLTPWQ